MQWFFLLVSVLSCTVLTIVRLENVFTCSRESLTCALQVLISLQKDAWFAGLISMKCRQISDLFSSHVLLCSIKYCQTVQCASEPSNWFRPILETSLIDSLERTDSKDSFAIRASLILIPNSRQQTDRDLIRVIFSAKHFSVCQRNPLLNQENCF